MIAVKYRGNLGNQLFQLEGCWSRDDTIDLRVDDEVQYIYIARKEVYKKTFIEKLKILQWKIHRRTSIFRHISRSYQQFIKYGYTKKSDCPIRWEAILKR